MKILDANSNESFRINTDVIHLFDESVKFWMLCTWRRNNPISVLNQDRGADVCMLNWSPNSSEWINTITDDGKKIIETHPGGASDYKNSNLRIIFGRDKNNHRDPSFRFYGVFIQTVSDETYNEFTRIASKIIIHGSPVEYIELVDEY